MRNHRKNTSVKSIKVRDLPGDKSRTVTAVIKRVGLTTEEEIVFRMRRGVPLATEERLEFCEGNDITRRRLASYTAQVFAHHRRNRGHRN
ncbi:MAG: hypothetical protein HZC05_03705 [Candidatus Magasanikbacteria bacterium]|nr:hypothetical protein [Candidatus Magasanikbacteria bacterium]